MFNHLWLGNFMFDYFSARLSAVIKMSGLGSKYQQRLSIFRKTQTLSRDSRLRVTDAAIERYFPRGICLSLPDGEVLVERCGLIVRAIWSEFPGSGGITEITPDRDIGKDRFPVNNPLLTGRSRQATLNRALPLIMRS